MEPNVDLTMWSAIVGFLMPPLLAVIQQPFFTDRVRSVLAFLASAVAAVVTVFIQGDLDFDRFVHSGLVVMTVAMATYQNFWKRTGVAPAIEHATSTRRG